MTLTEATSECVECGAPIYRYCHSQAGSLKAYVWTDIDPDGGWNDPDPRWGTLCYADPDASIPPWHIPSEGDA
jgi:hypothetical protein